MEQLPVLSVDLVDTLNKEYPECSPDPADTERELWMKAGERRLVRGLLARKREAEEDQLMGTR